MRSCGILARTKDVASENAVATIQATVTSTQALFILVAEQSLVQAVE